VASSVGWKSGPDLFYHIYCMITSPIMGIGVGRARQSHEDRGEDAGHAVAGRENSKTSRELHRER
jgi:hypothetical protein